MVGYIRENTGFSIAYVLELVARKSHRAEDDNIAGAPSDNNIKFRSSLSLSLSLTFYPFSFSFSLKCVCTYKRII